MPWRRANGLSLLRLLSNMIFVAALVPFTGIETNSAVDNWHTACAIFSTKIAELEELNMTVGSYVSGETGVFRSADIKEYEMIMGFGIP